MIPYFSWGCYYPPVSSNMDIPPMAIPHGHQSCSNEVEMDWVTGYSSKAPSADLTVSYRIILIIQSITEK